MVLPGKNGNWGETLWPWLPGSQSSIHSWTKPRRLIWYGGSFGEGGFELGPEFLVHAQQLARLDAVREQLADDGDVHRRPGREEGGLALAVEIAVLRGHREGRHQPMVLGLFHQHFQQELGGAFHEGIVRLEEFPVPGERVVLPQMRA